jgi:RNA polymerase sigma factor (sigma-70 family)
VTEGERFALLVVPHLNAAFNLARWLTRNEVDAQDVVQNAMLRALRYLHSLRGADARPWLLGIVRNECMSWLRARSADRGASINDASDPGQNNESHGAGDATGSDPTGDAGNRAFAALAAHENPPEHAAIRRVEARLLNEAIAALPPPFREAIVLRELEDLSYRDIAQITGVPIGTVMSRLSRARRLLAQSLQVIAVARDRTTN